MQLIMNPGSLNEQVFEFAEDIVTIGRAEESSLCVLNMSLSRQHAQLERDGNRIILRNLKSKNGTFVNDIRVERCELRGGDIFRCGEVCFKLVSTASVELSPELAPTQVQSLHTQLSPESMDDLLESQSDDRLGSALKVKRSSGVDRAKDKLQVLLKVGQILSSPGPIEVLLERILQLVFQILDVDRVAVLLVEPSTGQLRPRVARLSTGETPPGQFYSQHIVDYVRNHNVAALFSDARLDPRLGGASSVMQQSICASMCTPLKPRDKLLGVLYVDNLCRPNGFSEEDLEFLTAFANQAAISLENAALHQQLQEEAVLRTSYLRFFPPATLKKLQHERGARLEIVETEVTILFADISDFTSLSSSLQPRQVVDMLNEYFPVMADIVFRYEGTLEKYIGDALLAVWGAPFSHPDDVDRAMRAAVEMQEAMSDLNARWRAQGRVEIQIHVGVNTGRVAAGNIGSEQYLQYATIGDATNVASRVCSEAGPGEICITQATYERWRERAWRTSPLPPTWVKGKQEPLSLHRVAWRDTMR